MVDELEGTGGGAAAPEADELVAAREDLDGIGDEVPVIRDGNLTV